MTAPRGNKADANVRKGRAYGDGWCAFEDGEKMPDGLSAADSDAWAQGYADARAYHNDYGRKA